MVTLVCGPVGSGKSRYVKEHMKRGDVALDLDEIFKAFTLLPMYDKPDELIDLMLLIKGFVVTRFVNDKFSGKESDIDLWIIECAPQKKQRRKYESLLDAKIVLLDVPADECKRRIREQGRRDLYMWDGLIDTWWTEWQ